MKQQDGRLVLVALFENTSEVDFNRVVRKQVAVQGSWGWLPEDYLKGIELVQTGKVDRNPLVSHTFPLDQAPEAFATQEKPDAAIKILVQP